MNNTNNSEAQTVTQFAYTTRSPERYNWIHTKHYKIPKDLQFEDNRFLHIAGLKVRVIQPPVPGQRKHRMLLDLECGRTISAGRIWQHMQACPGCKANFNLI